MIHSIDPHCSHLVYELNNQLSERTKRLIHPVQIHTSQKYKTLTAEDVTNLNTKIVRTLKEVADSVCARRKGNLPGNFSRNGSSIYMRALYEELRKSDKK